MENLSAWFDSQNFMPHGHCYLWRPEILWLHVGSDLLIGLAYYSIPLAILAFIRKRPEVTFRWVFALFAMFIFACGTTHLFDIFTTWQPSYFVEGLIKGATALISVTTAILLWPLLPHALRLPSPQQLQEKNEQLQKLNDKLEMLVTARSQDSARLAAIVESTGLAVLAKDLNDTITDWNAAASKLYGYRKEEIIGQPITRLLLDEEIFKEEYRKIMELVSRGETPPVLESKRRTKDGRVLDVALAISPLKDRLGRIIGASSVARDITRRKALETQLEDSERLMRTIIESIPNGIVLANAEGRIVLSNPALEKMFGYGPGELIGRTIEQLIPERLRLLHGELRQSFWRDPKQRQMGAGRDLSALHKDGIEFPVEVGLAPVWHKQHPSVLASVIDISERKKIEQKVQQTHLELQAAHSEMEQFVYAVSHDLKSPIVTMASFLLFLREDLAEGNTAAVQDSLDELEKAQRRMKALIDDLLELSRIGRVELKTESVDLGAVLTEVLAVWDEQLKQKGFKIKIADNLPTVHANASRLTQVIENIVSNAIKYGSDAPTPTLEVAVHRTKNHTQICFKDNGSGIDPVYHTKVFELFQRLDTSKEGTGLGLAIAQRIMATHGGKIWLNSSPGQGAEFWVSLPKFCSRSKEMRDARDS